MLMRRIAKYVIDDWACKTISLPTMIAQLDEMKIRRVHVTYPTRHTALVSGYDYDNQKWVAYAPATI